MKYVGIGLVAACGQGPTVNSFIIQNDSGIGLLVGEQTDTNNCGNGTDIRGFYMEDVEEHYVNLTDFRVDNTDEDTGEFGRSTITITNLRQ